jgi:hypothetical protein
MAFDQATGLPNELFAEQILQSDLGQKLEMQAPGPPGITLVRLEDLFHRVLTKDSIDLGSPPKQQLESFLNSQAAFFSNNAARYLLRPCLASSVGQRSLEIAYISR